MKMHTITKKDWIRFILSNHKLYNTKQKLSDILTQLDLNPEDINLAIEPWFETNNWWDDVKFVQALHDIGVVFPHEIQIIKSQSLQHL